jgi:predicted metal-dependent hydrolase
MTASFPVRRVDLEYANIDKYPFDGEPVQSVFWLVVQALFPDGERFFIRSVRDVRDRVEDPQLQEDIRAFMGQEAMHGAAHRKANQAIADRHGIDVQTTERRTEIAMRLFDRFHTPMQRLAMTAFAEHFTSSLARYLLKHPEYMAKFRGTELRHLIMWHALEEREHRAVAFDVYTKAGGGYWTRVIMGPYFIGLLIPWVFFEIGRVLAQQGELRNWRRVRSGLRALFGPRSALQGIGPYMRRYFARDFHPSQDDLTELEAEWRRELGLAA